MRLFSGATLQPCLDLVAGSEPGELLGAAIAPGPADANGDGRPDLFVGRPRSDAASVNGGLATVFALVHHQPDLGFQGPGVAAMSMVGTQLYGGGEAFVLTLQAIVQDASQPKGFGLSNALAAEFLP